MRFADAFTVVDDELIDVMFVGLIAREAFPVRLLLTMPRVALKAVPFQSGLKRPGVIPATAFTDPLVVLRVTWTFAFEGLVNVRPRFWLELNGSLNCSVRSPVPMTGQPVIGVLSKNT